MGNPRIGLTIEGPRLSIQANSLEVIDEVSEKEKREIHGKRCEVVLETDRFPEIEYECSRVSASGSGDRYWVALNGRIDVARSDQVGAGVGESCHQRQLSAGTGDFSIRQRDYEIAAVSAAGGSS
jgi:hypothetical protein